MKRLPLIAWFALSFALVTTHEATSRLSQVTPAEDGAHYIALHYSDGAAPSIGLEAVNARLAQVGVRVRQIAIPKAAQRLLQSSEKRALQPAEADALIRFFEMKRGDLVAEALGAGRTPTVSQGGVLQTSEADVPPYPKVYDMQALDDPTVTYLQRKFGRLHVNSSEAGVGIDEVMTIVSGGPYTWFFVFPGNIVGKLRFGTVEADGPAWRISYPGLVPHGGFFDAEQGRVVAYAHGPKHFVMRYADPSVDGYETLGDNPWIDFTADLPRLLTTPRSAP